MKPESGSTSLAPLAGLRILDLTRLLPGPLATLHLADLGADVIKIEESDRGDYARWMGPVQKTQSGWFLAINRNKRSVSLDLKSEEGRDDFLSLVESADAVVESFRPGVMSRLGLGFDVLQETKPGIVLASISGYGQTGPDRTKAGHDINYCARSGVLEQAGSPGGPPAPGNFQIADLAGGSLSSVMGLLAALLSVARGGPGRHVDVAMTDCTIAHNIMGLMDYQATGTVSARGAGMLSGGLPNYRVYQTLDDRYLAVGALEDKFWSLFCKTIAEERLLQFDLSVKEDCAQACEQLAGVIISKELRYWTELVADVDCCVGPVLDLSEVAEDPQIQSRGVFFTASHPTEGNVTQFACPVKMTDFSFEVTRPAPLLGEHTDEVFLELRGKRPD